MKSWLMGNTAAGVGGSTAERAQQQVMIIQLKSIPVTFTFWFLIYKAMDKIYYLIVASLL